MGQARLLSRRGVSAATALANAEAAIVAGDPQIDAHITALAQAAVGSYMWPWKSGNFYNTTTLLIPGSTSTLALTADRLMAVPIIVPPGESISQLATNANAGAAAGKLMRLGLFTVDVDGRPGAFIDGSAAIAADSTGLKTYDLAIPVGSGRYFAVIWSDGTPTVLAIVGSGVINPFGEAGSSSLGRNMGIYHSLAFGSWPVSFGSADGFIVTTIPQINVRAV